MAGLDSIKERISSEAHSLGEKLGETSVVIHIKERYQNLTPTGQRLILIGSSVVLLLLLISLPLSSFLNSVDSVNKFESQRDLIDTLYKASSEIQNSTGITPAPPIPALQTRIQSDLKNAMIVGEQIRGVVTDSIPAKLPRESIDGALSVSLIKLNLRQIVDVGYQIQSISPAVKIADIDIVANSTMPNYFDVVYKVVTLKVPVFAPPEPEPEPTKKPGKKTEPKPDDAT